MPFNLFMLAASIMLAQPTKPSFVVECRVVDLQKIAMNDGEKTDSAGKKTVSAHIGTHYIATTAPKITLADGQLASVSNECQRPFVTATKATPHGKEAKITVLKEGLKIGFSVTSIDAQHVSLDATIQDSRINDVDVRPSDEEGTMVQAPTVETVQVRAIGPVRLGQKLEVSCGNHSDRSVEFVIRRSDALAQSVKLPMSSIPDGPWQVERAK